MRYFILFLAVAPYFLSAQDNALENYGPRWQTRVGAGIYIPLTRPARVSSATDPLVVFDGGGTSFTLSSAYFITPRWGIELGVQGTTVEDVAFVSSDFRKAVDQNYAADYFVLDTYTTADYEYSSGFADDIRAVVFGPVYRFRKRRVLLTSKLLMGTISRENISGGGRLKQPDSHRIIKLHYGVGSKTNKGFIIATAFCVGYQLGKRWTVSTDMEYSVNRLNLAYAETIQDLLADETVIHRHNYSRTLHTLSLGISVCFSMAIRNELN